VPARTSPSTWLHNPVFWIVCVLVAVLVCKFFWFLFVFDLPLGYDAGMYRYLFLRHAEGFPPFWITNLEPWARAHPLGLFMFSSVLLRLGIPVDWLIGWMWNLFAVVLLCTLAWVSGKRYSTSVGVWTLVAAVLSVASFDGFAAMYWKTFASLFWMILAFRAIEKRSLWSIPFGILTVITHSQTGLLFGLVLSSYAVLPFIPWVQPSHPMKLNRKNVYPILAIFGGGLIILCVGLLAYLPIWKDAVTSLLPALLGQTEAASGSFPSALHYIQTEAVILLFGAVGFVLSIRRGRWSVWQLSVIWSFLFVALHLLFYRRFFLQLEFFLLPFAGIGFNAAWKQWKDVSIRSAIIVVLVVQGIVMQQTIKTVGPMTDEVTFQGILRGRDIVPSNAFILGLENDSPVVLRGWFPHQPVGGPGLFDSSWTQHEWGKFLLGTHGDRVELFRNISQPVYLFASPLFHDYYGEYAAQFLTDPCFEQVDDTMYYRVVCQP
jgi:hypothetical protein